jgi:hypothetical protein
VVHSATIQFQVTAAGVRGQRRDLKVFGCDLSQKAVRYIVFSHVLTGLFLGDIW